MIEYRTKWLKAQKEVFLRCQSRRRFVRKGGRLGFTAGGSFYFILECMKGNRMLLWGDTIQTNLRRYFDKYWRPELAKLPDSFSWEYNSTEHIFKMRGQHGEATVHFRSAEKPYNWEGFSYDVIYLNEAGIILKGEKGLYIWQQAVRKMLVDNPDSILIAGGVPKGSNLFSELLEDAEGKASHIIFGDSLKKDSTRAPDSDYAYFHFSMYDNEALALESVQEAERDLGEMARQEVWGYTIDSGDSAKCIFPPDAIRAAMDKWRDQRDTMKSAPVTRSGIDPSRGGADDTSIAIIRNTWYADIFRNPGSSSTSGDSVRNAFLAIRDKEGFSPSTPCIIDVTGIGSSAFDSIEKVHQAAVAFTAAGKVKAYSENGYYELNNHKVNAYWKFREKLIKGEIAIPDDQELYRQAVGIHYDIGTNNRIIIEKKEATKKRIGRSPDDIEAIIMALYDYTSPVSGFWKK